MIVVHVAVVRAEIDMWLVQMIMILVKLLTFLIFNYIFMKFYSRGFIVDKVRLIK